jgi:hypothetical protein
MPAIARFGSANLLPKPALATRLGTSDSSGCHIGDLRFGPPRGACVLVAQTPSTSEPVSATISSAAPFLLSRFFPYPDGFFPNEIDNRVLSDMNTRNANALFGPTLNSHRTAIGLPAVKNVRDYAYTDHPWPAADPTLGPWRQPANLDVVQTGAWLLHDERPLPAGPAG